MIRFVIVVAEGQNTFTTALRTGDDIRSHEAEDEDNRWDVQLSDNDEKLFLELTGSVPRRSPGN